MVPASRLSVGLSALAFVLLLAISIRETLAFPCSSLTTTRRTSGEDEEEPRRSSSWLDLRNHHRSVWALPEGRNNGRSSCSASTATNRQQQSAAATTTSIALAQHALIRVAAAALHVPSSVWAPSPPMVEPPARSPRERAHRAAAAELLERGWTHDERQQHEECYYDENDRAMTYGEVTTPTGARQLLFYMGLLPTTTQDSQEQETKQQPTVFVDLGSGKGKLVVQAYLEAERCSKAVGIELDPARHATAVVAWTRIAAEHQRTKHNNQQPPKASWNDVDAVQFVNADMFDRVVDDVLAEATHIYVASLCFSNAMMERLARQLQTVAATHHQLECVASLKEIPGEWWSTANNNNDNDGVVVTRKVEYVEMSWTQPKGCAVYFYHLDASDGENG